ncbi:MAG: adenylate/guanylate cyclase domain-containing protein [Alphaproteobacteria bacterium]|nr:adenylate/guanylate cyclase domain-containing protein [Alphaproteobacteria bacterium]MBL6952174.1 adenylate/guanylate cyclase domain-containing protein [Alphaproteobacteria bacterium]
MSSGVQRKLTTILAADAEGYSREMEADEVRTLNALHAARGTFSKFIERHHGRIANTAGDGLIAEFPSVVEAVECAIEVQRELGGSKRAAESALHFRIGIHLGDVMIDGDDLLGAGVNLAARLQTMAEPGGILISQQVYDQVQHKLSVGFEYLGEKRPKNFAEDVAVYRVSLSEKESRRNATHRARKAPPPRTPVGATLPQGDLRERVIRHAKLLGAIWALVVAVDLITGEPFWAHWPGIAMAALVALEAVPLLEHRWFQVQFARGVVIVAALALVNLFTWSGYPWAMWPASALIAIELFRRLGVRR